MLYLKNQGAFMEQLLYILDLDLQRRDYASTATPTKPLRYRTSFNPPVLTARCKNQQPEEHKHNKEDIGTWKPTTPLPTGTVSTKNNAYVSEFP